MLITCTAFRPAYECIISEDRAASAADVEAAGGSDLGELETRPIARARIVAMGRPEITDCQDRCEVSQHFLICELSPVARHRTRQTRSFAVLSLFNILVPRRIVRRRRGLYLAALAD